MSTNNRDTKFLGFAALVLEEMSDDIVNLVDKDAEIGNLENMGRIIARRAYDLAYHVQFCSNMHEDYCKTASQLYKDETRKIVDGIPDLTSWPITDL